MSLRSSANSAKSSPPQRRIQLPCASLARARAERAIRPESIALEVFGGISATVTLLIGAPVISRRLRDADDDRQVLRALGAGPSTTAFDGLIGVLLALTAGALGAVVVAAALSPLAPIGPVRHIYRRADVPRLASGGNNSADAGTTSVGFTTNLSPRVVGPTEGATP